MIFSKMQLGTVQFGLDYGVANTSGKPSYEIARNIIIAAITGWRMIMFSMADVCFSNTYRIDVVKHLNNSHFT